MLSYIVLSLLSGAAWAGETPLTADEINKFGISVDRDASGVFSLKAEKPLKQGCLDNLSVSYGSASGDTLKLGVNYNGKVTSLAACNKALKKQTASVLSPRVIKVESADLAKLKADLTKVQLNDAPVTNLTAKIAKAEVKKVPVAKDKVKFSFKDKKLFATVETTEDCKDDVLASMKRKDGATEYKKSDGLEKVADEITVAVTEPESCTGDAVTVEIPVGSFDKNNIATVSLAGEDEKTKSPSYLAAEKLEGTVNCPSCHPEADETKELAQLLKNDGIAASEIDEISDSILKKASQDKVDSFTISYNNLKTRLGSNPGQTPAERLEDREMLLADYNDLLKSMRKAKTDGRISADDMKNIIGNPSEFTTQFVASVDALEGLTQGQLDRAFALRGESYAAARGTPFLDEKALNSLKTPQDVAARPWIASRDAGMTHIQTFMYKGQLQTYVANAQKYLEACQTNLPAIAKNPTAQGMAYAYQCNQAAAKLPEYQNTLAELDQRQQAVLGNLMGTAANTAGSTYGLTKFISSNGGNVSALGLTAQGANVSGLQGYSAMGFNQNSANANVQSAYNPGALQTQFQQQGTSGNAINFLNNGNGRRF